MAGSTPLAIVVLAAGEGKRMRSSLPKVLHEVAGRPILEHVLRAAEPLKPERIVVMVGFGGDQVVQSFRDYPGVTFVYQDFSTGYGTGHALRESAKGLEGFTGNLMVLNGDGPMLRTDTLSSLAASVADGEGMALVTCHFSDPTGLGRIVRDASGAFSAIVEHKEATPEQLALDEINPGVYLFDDTVFDRAKLLDNSNASGEYYITDLPGLYLQAGQRVATVTISDETELLGINDKSQLALADAVLRHRIRRRLLEDGVTMLHPDTTFVDDSVQIGKDVVLEQGVVLRGRCIIGDGCRIGAYSVLENVKVPAGSNVSPHSVQTG